MMRIKTLALGAAMMAAAACEAPEAPVRPTPYDFRLFKSDTVFHWPEDRMPVRVYAEPVGRMVEDVAAGLQQWQRQFLYGELSTVMVTDPADADVLVFLDGPVPPDVPPSDDPPRAVCGGYTALPPRDIDGSGNARFTDRLQISVSWSVGEDPTDVVNCLQRVIAHELGHALGIFDHSADPFDLMHPEPSVTLPSPRDQSTILTLYHLPTDILPWEPGAFPEP